MADIFGTPTDDQLIGTSTADQIQGMEGHDVIDGNAGDDLLVGGIGDDMYVFNPGDGNDIVNEMVSGGYDTIRMTGGIYPGDVQLFSNGYDLIIQSYTGNQITVIGHFDPVMPQAGIERILFSDGTIWDRAAIETRIATNNQNIVTPGNDVIVGTPGMDVIDGGDGNDTISGTNGNDTLIGSAGNDVLIGGPGYDTLLGGDGNDVLRGMANSDQLNGGMGNDTYINGYGSGQDEITDEGGNDTLYLGSPNTPGIFQAELTQLMRNATDLIVDSNGSQITIRNYFDAYNPQATNPQLPIERIVFEDGTIWETEQILARLNSGNNNYTSPSDDVIIGSPGSEFIAGDGGNDTLSGGAGNDQLNGDWGNDRLFGNAGNDNLMGGDGNDLLAGNAGDDILDGWTGNDTYYFNRGDGHDVVYEWNWGETNRVVFGDGISIQDLQFSQQGTDLVITLFGSGDSLRLNNTTMDPYGPKGVSLLEFADGMVLDLSNANNFIGTQFSDNFSGTFGNDAIYALAGNDNIQGNEGDDTIYGGTGMDSIEGGAGSDTYVYNLGDGLDRIAVSPEYVNPIYQPVPVNGVDTLQLGEGIDPSNVLLETYGWDLSVRFLGSPGDEIIVQEYFNTQRMDSALDQIVFADGTVWNAEAISNRVIQFNNIFPTPQGDTLVGTSLGEFISGMEGNDTISGGTGNDQIYGDQGNDRLFGNSGNDTLSGGFGNDVMTGGNGDDFLRGDTGSDSYQFTAGDGMDEIIDDDRMPFGAETNRDVIRLGEGYDAALVLMQRMGDDLVISMPGSSDQITVRNHFTVDYTDGGTHNAIESIMFADGTSWNIEAINNRVNGPMTGMTIAGTAIMDYLNGGNGNDTISGGGGDDQVFGDQGNDRLFGNAGNDQLQGGMGNDTYYFNLGDGQDVITEWYPAENNRVVFGAGIGIENLRVTQLGPDTLIEVVDTMDSIRLTNTNIDPNFPPTVNQFEFADGTVISLNQLQNVVRGSSAADYLSDLPGNDVITGLGGNDNINAYDGNNTILGGAGDDNINGGLGNDVIIGGTGNDNLVGFRGNDTYVFNLGDGMDRIRSESFYPPQPNAIAGIDTIRFGEGIDPTSVYMMQSNEDLVISYGFNPGMAYGPTDQVVIEGYYSPQQPVRSINQIVFADGTVWNNDAIDNFVRQMGFGSPTDQGDTLRGTYTSDSIYGREGNDTISGGAGHDTMLGEQGNDRLFGNSGNDFISGREGNDLLNGGTGNDVLWGETGSDTYQFNTGDGVDEIIDDDRFPPFAVGTNQDTIQLGEGYEAALVRLQRIGDDLVISMPGSTDQITVRNHYMVDYNDGGTHNAIESIVFADGTIWNTEAINNRVNGPLTGMTIAGMALMENINGGAGNDTISGGGGNDQIMGDAGNDRLFGNAGNDQLDGGTGNDTYYFNIGDGHDVISDATPGETNRVVFGQGISVQNLRVTQAGPDIRIDIIGTEDSYNMGDSRDSLWLANTTFVSNGPRAVSEFEFADGLVVNLEQLQNIIVGSNSVYMPDNLTGTPGNDTIVALAGPDTLAGGTGNDVLIGGSGPDRYEFNLGDGQDVIIDSEPASEFYMSMDSVQFGPGITQDIMTPGRMGNDLVIDFTSGDSLTIRNWYASTDNQVENLFFTDGSMLSAMQLQAWADNLSPQVTQPIDAQQANEDQPFDFYLPYNTFVDPNGSDVLVYSATLENNEPLPVWLNFDPNSGRFSGQPGNDDVDDLRIRVTATDPYGMTASTEFALTVNNVNDAPVGPDIMLDQFAAEDQPFSLTLPADLFTDVDAVHGDTLTYSVAMADRSPLPTWLNFDPVTRTFSGTPTNDDVRTLALRITATDRDQASDSVDFNLIVTNTNDAPTLAIPLVDANAAEGSAFSYTVPSNTFADVDVGDSLTYTAALADGSVLPNWLSFNAATRTFTGNPVDGNAGPITVRVTARDQSLASVFDDFTITVADSIATIRNGTSNSETINGTAFRDVINGLGGNDTLNGYAGNDALDGGSGSDTMYGGAGDDGYIVNSTGDKVIENTNEGIDTVSSSVSHTLANNVDNLTLTGSSSISATGNSLDNVLVGNSAGNTLTGNAGNDWLDGGAGSDTMRGGTGNDTYVVSTSGDIVTENANEGTDTVRTSISYTLGSNVENLVLTGSGNASGTGNSLNNSITGNSASNTLTGNAGNDILQGLVGNDTLRGGTGSDTYVFGRGDGTDTISENDSTVGNSDTIAFAVNPLDLVFTQSGSNLRVALHGSSDAITVQSWYSGSQYQTEVLTTADGYTLQSSQVNQLIQAMASFTSSSGLSWDQAIDQNPEQVQNIITAYWQPVLP